MKIDYICFKCGYGNVIDTDLEVVFDDEVSIDGVNVEIASEVNCEQCCKPHTVKISLV